MSQLKLIGHTRYDERLSEAWKIQCDYGYSSFMFDIVISEETLIEHQNSSSIITAIIEFYNEKENGPKLSEEAKEVKNLLNIIKNSSIETKSSNIDKVLDAVYKEREKCPEKISLRSKS